MELTEVHTSSTAADAIPRPAKDGTTAGKDSTLLQNDGLFRIPFVPKVERIPWSTFLGLSLCVSLPASAYLLLFTRLGFGLYTLSWIAQHLEPFAVFPLAVAVAGYFLVLFLADWTGHVGIGVGCLGAALLVVSLAGDYPYGPIALFTVGTALWMLLVWKIFYSNAVPARTFIGWSSGPLLFVSSAVLLCWLTWTLTLDAGSRWNSGEMYDLAAQAQAAQCDPNFDDFPQCRSSSSSSSSSSTTDQVCFTLDHDSASLVFDDDNCDEACATNVYADCLNPFILWVGPFLVSLCLLFLSFMATFLRQSVNTSTTPTHDNDNSTTQQQPTTPAVPNNSDSTTQQPQTPHQEEEFQGGPALPAQSDLLQQELIRDYNVHKDDIGRFAKLWMFLLFGMWVSASLAGLTGAGLSTALYSMTLAAFVASGILVAVSFRAWERHEQIAQGLAESLSTQEGDNATAFDAAKGLLVLTCTPVALVYLVLASIKQGIRRLRSTTASADIADDEAKNRGTILDSSHGWVTVEAQRLIQWASSWKRRTRVFTYAVYWGIAFVVMNVIVAQFTLLFLSWLIEQTTDMPLVAVTAILMGVGMCMFLLPPVPGVPIYLTLGIVIIPVGRESLGVAGSIAYAMMVSTFLKLLACTVQQKLIGGLLQHQVGVRQFVGVNSKVIRSMKLILAEPGLGAAKVSILIGGPDWPTSVLCGIMDLSWIQIMVGTLPIVFLILPTLLTGCFTYMGSVQVTTEYGQLAEEFPWADTLATVFATVTGLVQFGSMVVAAYYMERTVSERGDEIEAMPLDEEVLAADAKLEDVKKAYEEVTEWDMVPALAKGVLSASVVCIIVSCYMLQSLQDVCFQEYQLTYTIDEHLGGDWTSLVLPLGVIAIGLFVTAVVLLQIFISWAKREAGQKVALSAAGTPYASLGEC